MENLCFLICSTFIRVFIFLFNFCFFNPLYTGELIHCNMLDESICHFRDVGSVLLLFLFLIENSVSKQWRP